MRPAHAAITVAAAALGVAAAAAAVLWADLDADARSALVPLATPARIGLLLIFALALAFATGYLAYRMIEPGATGARRIAEDLRLIAHGNAAHRVPADLQGLDDVARAVNELADIRSTLASDVERSVAEAKAGIEEERSRLAALISELDQSVLVCNHDGRVLLYNAAARALVDARDTDGASGLLGLGRSVFGFLERAVVMHAVEALEAQVARSAFESVHFVTATASGRLLRVRAAPVVAAGDRVLSGYVLLLSDVTDAVDADARNAALFQNLTEVTRGGLANIRAAIESVTEHPQMDAARRSRFATIIRDEAVALSGRLNGLATSATEGLKTRWPLEEMLGSDLITLARSRIERRTGLATKVDSVDSSLWLRVDSFSLAQGLCYVARRLTDEFDVREIRLRLSAASGHAQLDALWRGPPLSSETAFAWQSAAFTEGGEDSPLTLAEVMQRHGGEAWYQRDVPTQTAYFRFLLPLADARASASARGKPAGRPEFYDFDLFRRSHATDALDPRPLSELSYTVLDTETTGLDPAHGDEIISIGAVRIVNGRVLTGETFESLVDPQRSLSEASTAVHGLTRADLAGQPTVDVVLPQLRRFCDETVLVGHNAAFDMRFLQLKEASAGVRFDQPVLDTLLLSAVVHPARDTHSLEAIAARLGVDIVGRHTAKGDALVTAEVFVRLLPLLAERGVRTLGEARAASETTYYARLKY